VLVWLGTTWNAIGKDEKIHNWPAYSGDKASTKYSPLDQINKDTVGKLSIAWRQSGVPAELKAIWPDASAPTNWQNTPIMVDGLLYMSSGVGSVVALDAATGRVVWFDVPPHDEGKSPLRGASTRGVAYWANGNESRIFAMNGANLIALNAKTGKRYPDWGTHGAIDLTRPVTTGRRHRLSQQQRPHRRPRCRDRRRRARARDGLSQRAGEGD
jgi:quinoprotein glucose dehydrogenase